MFQPWTAADPEMPRRNNLIIINNDLVTHSHASYLSLSSQTDPVMSIHIPEIKKKSSTTLENAIPFY